MVNVQRPHNVNPSWPLCCARPCVATFVPGAETRPLLTMNRNPKERSRLPDIARNPPESHAKRRCGGRAALRRLNSPARFVVEFWPESGAI